MSRQRFTVILLPEEGGIYGVICPAIQGCVSQGESIDEALANIKEAMRALLELDREMGKPMPEETTQVVADEIRAALNDRAEEGLPLTLETREVEIEVEAPV